MRKRILSTLLAGAMVLSLAACGSSTDNSNNVADSTSQGAASTEAGQTSDGQAQADSFTYPMDAVTLTVNGSVDGGVDFYDDSQHPAWAKDLYYYKVIREKTGVTLKDVGGAANATTMSDGFLLMLAGGELPDIVIAPWTAYTGGAAAAIDDGYVVDLMQYSEYLPNLMNWLDENPDVAAQVLTDDGRLAFSPFVKQDPVVGMGMVIRKDWLDALNLDEPTTVDELHDVLVAFKENYNCKAPLTFESRWLFQQGASNAISSAWLTTYQEYIIDGKVQFGPLTDEYKQFIKTLADWYKEGLLDPDFASVDKSTVQAKFSNGEAGVSLQQVNNIENCVTANEGTDYAVVALSSLVMNKGDEPQFSQQSIQKFDGGFGYAISSTCSNVEAACRYLDWAFSEEGMMTMNYGVEGTTYEVKDGKVELTDLVMHNEETPSSNSARNEIAWVQNRAGVSLDIDLAYEEASKEWINIWTAHMDEYVLPTVPYTEAQQDVISKKWGDIDDLCQEKILKYVIGSEDIDSTWDSFVSSIKEMGIEDVLAAKQEAYDAYLAKVESLK